MKFRTHYAQLSVTAKILVPWLGIFLGMWTVGTFGFGYFSTKRLEQNAIRATEELSSVVVEDFQQKKELQLLRSRWVADRSDVSAAVAAKDTSDLLKILLPIQASLDLDLIKLVDRQGSVLADIRREEIVSAKLRDEVAVRAASNGLILFDVIAAEGDATPLLAGLTSVKSSEKVLGGVIVGIAIDDRLLNRVRAKIHHHLVALSDSQVKASTLPDAKNYPWQPPKLNALPVRVTIGDHGYIAKSVAISGISGTSTQLVLLDSTDSLERSERSLWLGIGLFCTMGSAIATVLGIHVARWIVRPIVDLTNATQMLASGDLQTRIQITSEDEIGILARGFNLMVAQLAQRDRQIQRQMQQLAQTLEQLKITQIQMIAQEKLASLGTLTAGIAHEIRNPLNFINNFAELSLDLVRELGEELEVNQERLEPEAIAYLEELLQDLQGNATKIHHHGNRAESIVRNMLLHSRGGSGQWSETNLNALLEEAANLAYHGMRANDSSFNVTLRKDYDKTIGKIRIVPQEISRVFLNIISNGCYAVGEKRRKLGDDFSPQIALTTRNLGEKVEIRIRDNGLGMSPEVREKIFNPFFTTKPAGEGTGLGLSLSYDIIVQQHQGQLDVISEPGSYAEFIIMLPKKDDRPSTRLS
jgi:two-component system, NtrC family, sensor kinase